MMVRASTLLVLAAAAIAAHYAEVPHAVRVLTALPFLLVGPGLVWLNRAGDLAVPALVAAAVGLSLAMEAVIGSLLLISGLWSPQAGFGILLVTSVAGLAYTERGDGSAEVARR
jgi:hypothetical protein